METIANKTLEPIADMLNRLDVKSVFGEPAREGDETIIPVAQIMYGFGYGFGGEDASGSGSGGGGGAGGRATPRGYIHITPDGVTYTPTNNDTILGMLGMFTGIWSIFWIAVTIITLIKSLAGGQSEAIEAMDAAIDLVAAEADS